jgi:hypothetical protein
MVVSFSVRPFSRGGLSRYDRTEARISSVERGSVLQVRGDTTRARRRSEDVEFARKASGRPASMKLARAAGVHRIPK